MTSKFIKLLIHITCFHWTLHSVREYVPGVSYAWGFSQKHEKNSEREVSATLQTSAQGGFDLEVKIPEVKACLV